jgi:hypothetical protein
MKDNIGSINYLSKLVDIDRIMKKGSLETIHEVFVDAINTKHTVEIVEQSLIKPMHSKKDHPLIFMYFCKLQQYGILKKVIKPVPNFYHNYHLFTEWYHANVNTIDTKKIHQLVQELEGNPQYNELTDIHGVIYNAPKDRKILHSVLYENNFIGIDIQNEMETHHIVFKQYLIDHRHVVKLFVPKKTNESNKVDEPDMNLIAIIINAMDELSKKYNQTGSPNLDLTMCYVNKKKSICSFNRSLGSNNINSGLSLPGHYIILWRQEELYKVLIHELIHFHRFDFYDNDPMYAQLESSSIVPDVIGSDKLNESYTESLAIIIFCLLITCIQDNNVSPVNVSPPDNVFQHNHFTELLEKEIMFLMFQIAKVLNKFNIESFSDYIDEKKLIEQTTSFRSYFVIKLMLLLNLQDMVDFIDKGLIVHGSRIIDFGQLINTSYNEMKNNYNVINAIDHMLKLVKEHKTVFSWIYWTLRMSANDVPMIHDS